MPLTIAYKSDYAPSAPTRMSVPYGSPAYMLIRWNVVELFIGNKSDRHN